MGDLREDSDWFMVGLKFGAGFWLAGALFSAFGALLTWAALTHTFSTAATHAEAAQRSSMHFRGLNPSADSDPPPTVVTVPPRSVEACKELTGGQINEDFAKCRRGYTEVR